MSDIAKLSVALYLNSAQFSSELSKSRRQAKDWKSAVSNTVATAAKAVAASGITAAAGVALIYKQQAKVIDQTAKFADRIGITTEALTQMRYASDLTGVGADKMDMSLQRMTRRIAEAAQGSGEAAPAIKALGLNAAELANLTPDKQLYALADAFQNVGNHSEKVRLAFKLFDSEGVGMVNMLANGSQGLASMAAEADSLGVTLSRVDAAKIEMANDAMYRLDAQTNAIKQSMAVNLAPFVASLATEFLNYTKEFGGMNNVIIEGIHSVSKGLGILSNSFRGINILIQSSAVAWDTFKLGFMVMSNAVIAGLHHMGQFIFQAVITPLLQVLDVAGQFNDKAAEMASKLRTLASQPPPEIFDAASVNQGVIDVTQSLWELRTLAAKPMPSEGVETWYKNTREAIQKAAKDYASAIKNNSNISKDAAKTEDPAVTKFREATTQIQTEYTRRLEVMRAGSQAAKVQEEHAYEDRVSALTKQYDAAYKAAQNNLQLQKELEEKYQSDREFLWNDHLAILSEQNKGFWERYSDSLEENMMSMDKLSSNMLNNFSTQMGDAFESIMFDSESLGDAFNNMLEGMGRSVVNALGQMAAQWLAYQLVQLAVGKTTAASGAAGLAANAQASALQAGLNAYTATAAIPIVGPAAAPAAMATALAVTMPMAASISAAALGGVAGMAHDGMDYIPNEGTWLLNTGERVLTNHSANQMDEMYKSVVSGSGGMPSQKIEQHFHINGNGDQTLQNLVSEAAELGSQKAYQRVSEDFESGRGIRAQLKASTGI